MHWLGTLVLLLSSFDFNLPHDLSVSSPLLTSSLDEQIDDEFAISFISCAKVHSNFLSICSLPVYCPISTHRAMPPAALRPLGFVFPAGSFLIAY